MKCSERWQNSIQQACREPDPARSNRLITELHFGLSEALASHLGRQSGPNFHTWAVWGSRKAGVTIRQEDLASAIRNATVVAAAVGSGVGAATGLLAGRRLRFAPDLLSAALGLSLGCLAGGHVGRYLAVWSRQRAAQLVLAGNQTVLQDIGEQSARFLDLLEAGATTESRQRFFAGLRPGSSETHGQDRLAAAFRHYLSAFDSEDLRARQESMILGNCEIVHHEHIRLEPYIRGAMPRIVRRCATQRQMSYDVGHTTLAVGEDLTGTDTPTAAHDWTHIEQRMRYIFALFRQLHSEPQVFSAPYAS